MSDLWSEATRDVEAENHLRSLAAATENTKGVWQFLALSQDRMEYEERKALSLNALVFAANKHRLPVSEILEEFDRKFALLMEAKDFTVEIKDDDPSDKPKFNLNDKGGSDDNDDKSESDDEGDDHDAGDDKEGDEDNGDEKGGKPTSTEPHKKPSDGAMPGDDDGDDGDEDSKDKGDDDKSDDDSSDGDDKDKPDFLNKGGSRRYASILSRIEAGEDPTRWGRRVLAESENDDGGGAEGSNAGASSSSMASGPSVGAAPTGQVTSTAPPQGTVTDTNSGSTGTKPATAALIQEIGNFNPNLPYSEIVRIAKQVEARYYKVADGGDPLTYGDRGHVPDGPATSAVKNYQPPNPLDYGGGGDSGGGSDSDGDGDSGDSGNSGGGSKGGGGGGFLGEVGNVAGAAAKVLPAVAEFL